MTISCKHNKHGSIRMAVTNGFLRGSKPVQETAGLPVFPMLSSGSFWQCGGRCGGLSLLLAAVKPPPPPPGVQST